MDKPLLRPEILAAEPHVFQMWFAAISWTKQEEQQLKIQRRVYRNRMSAKRIRQLQISEARNSRIFHQRLVAENVALHKERKYLLACIEQARKQISEQNVGTGRSKITYIPGEE